VNLKLPKESVEYLFFPGIRAFRDLDDPTGLPVHVAFTTDRTAPADDEWKVAAWRSATEAKILLGEGGVVLEPGWYYLWVRVTGDVEKPMRLLDDLLLIT
jgi:hypothetical protein